MAGRRHAVKERLISHSRDRWWRWECERKPRSEAVEEDWGWLAHSRASLLAAHWARLASGHEKYSSFFSYPCISVTLKSKYSSNPGAEERTNVHLTVTHASESWGSQLLLWILYFTRSCQDNIEKQYLYQARQFRVGFGFFTLSNKTFSLSLPWKESFRLSHRRK